MKRNMMLSNLGDISISGKGRVEVEVGGGHMCSLKKISLHSARLHLRTTDLQMEMDCISLKPYVRNTIFIKF